MITQFRSDNFKQKMTNLPLCTQVSIYYINITVITNFNKADICKNSDMANYSMYVYYRNQKAFTFEHKFLKKESKQTPSQIGINMGFFTFKSRNISEKYNGFNITQLRNPFQAMVYLYYRQISTGTDLLFRLSWGLVVLSMVIIT